MSRFKDQLVELGTYSERFPGSTLRFEVPVSSLTPSQASERPLVEGDWKAQLVKADGSIVAEAVGKSGEHAMEWMVTQLRQISRVP